MRRSDKKANIAEANRLAEEAFMKEREMMGIPSPVKEEAPEYMEGQPSFDIEGAIKSLITNEISGSVEQMSGTDCEILFEAVAEKFSLIVNCSIEVDERPYYEQDTNSGTNGRLTITIDGGMMMVDNEDNEQDEIALTAEQLKPLEQIVNEIMNEDNNLDNYFSQDYGDDEPDPNDDYDRYREDGMYEEINEIKRITKRLLGE
jgi:hypothetical protein